MTNATFLVEAAMEDDCWLVREVAVARIKEGAK
jgi:hypothetical protein